MESSQPPSPPTPHSSAERTPRNDATTSAKPTAEFSTMSATSSAINGTKSPAITRRRKRRKEKPSTGPHSQASSSASPSSTRSCSAASFPYSSVRKRRIRLFSSRRDTKFLVGPGRNKPRDVEALALPLGMSIAAVLAQVLEDKDARKEKILVDHLSQICASAVRESLINVFGDKFECFVENFEKSFRSTLMTLRLISISAKASGGENKKYELGEYASEVTTAIPLNRAENCPSGFGLEECSSESLPESTSRDEQVRTHEDMEENARIGLKNQQVILHDQHIMQQLAFVSPTSSSRAFSSANNQTILSTLEKSVIEQARSNDLKTFEMGLTMKKLQLKERQLALNSDANFLERRKLSFGFSKASFKVEKFKNQVEDTRHGELLKKCTDCLVAGLFVMLCCVGYGVFIYSHQRIAEVTASCTPTTESKSWWIPKPMSSFNSGLQILSCQFQALTRMLAGGIMVFVIAYLLLQCSATASQTMPVTFIFLLLGVACGVSGKLCIDTLGGSGNSWLFLWEILCLIHLFSNVWVSALFIILHGPVNVSEKTESNPFFPYGLRRFLFYATMYLFLPLLCGFLPFASLGEWKDHFSSLVTDLLTTED